VLSTTDRLTAARRFVAFVLDNSLLLLVGACAAVVWANVDFESYDRVAHPLHFWLNDVAMVFFFALAAKEVFEATLPGGALASFRRAAVPLAAATGGMIAPAVIFALLASLRGPTDLVRGWAIPCATDIAFSAMVARAVFGRGHPAVPFLLLLAIADDALGLVILAVFYPSGSLSPTALLLLLPAAALLAIWMKRRQVRSFWPYVLGPGAVSWTALYIGGVHPALALVPIIPLMPHSRRDLGIFDRREPERHDALSRFEHWWARPVQVVLLFFGFANAGVPFEQIGAGTWYVLAGLLVGKPLGIGAATGLSKALGGHLPSGLGRNEVIVLGIAASIGFTVSLFFATAAFPGGAALSETKMGALLSLVAAPMAVVAARLLRVTPIRRETASAG
jgi:NhaA family Na+:H+ antiporter